MSIKQHERQRRNFATNALIVHIHGPSTPMPKQWKRFLTQDSNKAALAHFLLGQWVVMGRTLLPHQSVYIAGCDQNDECRCVALYPTGYHEDVPELNCSHEEADTRMLLHAAHAYQHNSQKITIHSPDTDVLVLCVSFQHVFPPSLLSFCTGVSDNRRTIDVSSIAGSLGSSAARNLLAMHALTGCDTTSAFYGVGKQAGLKVLLSQPTLLDKLGDTFEAPENVCNDAEYFIVKCYSKQNRSRTSTINEIRYVQFMKTQRGGVNLPPCQSTLKQHIARANYQTAI